jgi:putative hemolysin
MLILKLTIVGCLILINGLFAMSELALMSSRRSRLQQMAESGSRGAAHALRLLDDPTGFLSTVQIGITLVGIFAGAYSGATLSEPLAARLAEIRALAPYAETLAFGLVVVAITYLSLVVGELVPKRLAISHAESIAALVAPPMMALARLGAPLVWFLRVSTEAVLKVLGVRPQPDSTVTEDEIKSLIAEGTVSGVFAPAEREMIEGVLRLADRPVRAIMVPRPQVVWLDVEDDPQAALDEIVASRHSRYPVSRGEVDAVFGIVHTKDLLDQQQRTGTIALAAAVRAPLFVNEHLPILRLLESFKGSTVHMAVVVDEHGSFEGVVTPTDILIAIAGDLPEEEGEQEPDAVQREDGSWLLDGRMAIEDVERTLGLRGMEDEGDYHTMAGFVLWRFGYIPQAGEHFVWHGWRFEVIDLDRRRIDKVLASRLPEPG